MAAVKTLAGLLLLGFLVSGATSSPIKGNKETPISHPIRFMRIKTVVRASQNQQPLSPSNRFYPDPQSPVAHFDSSFSPPPGAVNVQDQVIQREEDRDISTQHGNEGISKLADEQARQDDQIFHAPEPVSTQSLRSSGGHSHLPAIVNFGDRIQKDGQDTKISGCHVKGSCSTVSFTSDGQVSVGGISNVGNNFEKTPQSATASPYDEQIKVGDQPQTVDEFEVGQNKDDSYNENKNIPDIQGEGKYEISQEFTGDENTRDQGSIQDGFKPETQFVGQQDSPDYSNGQHSEGSFPIQEKDTFIVDDRQSSSFSGYPVEQTADDTGSNYERPFGGTSQFDQSQGNSGSFFTNVHESQDSGIQRYEPDQSSSFDDSHHTNEDGQYNHYGNPIDWLRYSVPGNPGDDYPILYQVPQTSFSCKDQPFSGGIFGDVEASCQVFHVCKESGGQDSFLCPNGTVFNQQYFVCDWWYNFRCSDTPSFYNLNADLYWDWENFTPSQMFDLPVGNKDGPYSNFESGSQGSFASNNEDRQPEKSEIVGQNNGIQNTIPADKSDIRDENPDIYEQRVEDAFAQEEPAVPDTGNVHQNAQQDFYGQQTEEGYPQLFTSNVRRTTGGLGSSAVSPIAEGRVETFTQSHSTGSNNDKIGSGFYPVASDTGANRKPGSDAGTRYPDQREHGPQSNSNFQPSDQNRPSFDVQRNIGSPLSGENFPQEKLHVQEQEPVDFENRNSFGGSDSSVEQNNYRVSADKVSQLDISQQIPSHIRNNGEGYSPQTQVQQEHLSNTFGGDRPQAFNPSGNDNTQNFQGSFTSQDHRNGLTQEIQQEYMPTSSFGDKPGISSNKDENYNRQNQGSSLDISQQSILGDDHSSSNSNKPVSFQDENSGSFGHQPQITLNQDHITTSFETDVKENFGKSSISRDIQENQEVQQEYISSSVDDQKRKEIGTGEVTGTYDTSNHFANGQNEDARDFNSPEQVHLDDTTYGAQNVDGNENSGQEHISSFSGNDGDSTPDSITGKDHNNNKDYDSSQIGGHDFSQANNADYDTDNNDGNKGTEINQGIQQEYIPSFDDIKPNGFISNENIGSEIGSVNGQRQTIVPFHPNGQNPSENEDNIQFQNIGGNQEVRQEHVSDPFNGFRPNVIGTEDNRGNTVIDTNQHVSFGSQDNVDRNNYQVTEQKHISDHFGESQSSDYGINQEKQDSSLGASFPNAFGSEVKSSNSYNQDNQDIQQDSVFVPFDENTEQAFTTGNNEGLNSFISPQDQSTSFPSSGQSGYNRDQTYGSSDNQQNKSPEVQQKDVAVTFGGSIPKENTGKIDNDNADKIYEVQQDHVTSTFNGPQSNSFESVRNDGTRTMQGQHVNVQEHDYRRFNQNPQNNFRVRANNEQSFQVIQNLRQEHISSSFDNNHQSNFHGPNSFRQEVNQGNLQQHSQPHSPHGYQRNSFQTGSSGGHQNTNAAFQMRLNNFQPANIHMRNRGGFQNRNYEQRRLSFRPYGQNQNTVIFPGGQYPAPFASNPSLGGVTAYSNDKSPSNRNFFVTNGHQVRDEQSQQTGNSPLPNQRPADNIQVERRRHGSQNIQRLNQDQFNSGPAIEYSANENADSQRVNVEQVSPTSPRNDNQNANSATKSYSSQNYRNGRNVDISTASSTEINSRGSPPIAISADDVLTYNQPESPTSMNNNGWKPVVKY